jgi:precorrin-6A/cobalt-precorrin-6A reductase
MMRVLLLGGTGEAGQMARALAAAGVDAIYSYAGRTEAPVAQPLPTRIGGFGGVTGLVDYLRREKITHVIDATHPFAAQMSTNAVVACRATGVSLLAVERPGWDMRGYANCQLFADLAAVVAALDRPPCRVFLAIGRQHLDAFRAQPQHHYLLRLVDPPEGPPLPDCTVIVARGPFDVAGDTALLRDHRIDLVVAKNAGGAGAVAKITAAKVLQIPILMVDRPKVPDRPRVETVAEAMDRLHQMARLGV